MVRMSDILKKAREKEKEAKEKKEEKITQPKEQNEKPSPSVKPSPKPVKFAKKGMKAEEKDPEVRELEEPIVEQKLESEAPEPKKVRVSKVRISPVVMRRAKAAESDESVKLYEKAVSLMREILKKDINPESIDAKRVTTQAEIIIEQLGLGNEKLLELALITQVLEGESYLYCHSVNVCIYSTTIGLGLGYDKLQLVELGISALLHDIGMTEYLHLANQSRKLTSREFKEIKKHPLKGTGILENVKNLKKVALHAVHQEHEREDGTGYPRGLRKNSISEHAGIIAIVDSFEAMIHPRAYRSEFLPIEALRKILNNKKAFKRKLIKILIERIGIFPVGSLVRLNTREICRVIKLNQEIPLRPVVNIMYDAAGEESKEARAIDLATQPNVFIKKGVRNNELFKEALP